MIYTHSEQTQKKYTVEDAVNAAGIILREKGKAMNRTTQRNLEEKITLVELNNISDDIVQDSLYYYN